MYTSVERFKKRTIWFHWIHTTTFLAMVITGTFMFVPGWGIVAQDSITSVIHRISAVLFVIGPVIYFFTNPKMSLHFIKDSFTWGRDDIEWLKAAPRYYMYLPGGEEKMPPQGRVNTGQKYWQLTLIITFVMFVVTGTVMTFFKGIVSPGVFQWCLLFHDMAFLGGSLMLMLHIYPGIVHPRMSESMRSMYSGKVSTAYAKSQYGKWYEKVAKSQKVAEK